MEGNSSALTRGSRGGQWQPFLGARRDFSQVVVLDGAGLRSGLLPKVFLFRLARCHAQIVER